MRHQFLRLMPKNTLLKTTTLMSLRFHGNLIHFRLWPRLSVALLFLLACATSATAQVRIKDITTLGGEHPNQLVGLGLVTGLAGTGGANVTTRQFALNLLERMGLRADPVLRAQIANASEKTNSLSVVMVSATLPPHAQPSQRIDVLVSTFDDAKSLLGGNLLFTPLSGPDGQVYAIASGPVSVGGFNFAGQAASVSKNHTTTGRIPNGAVVEEAVRTQVVCDGVVKFLLTHPDYETARRIADAVDKLSPMSAVLTDPATVSVRVPPEWMVRPHDFIAQVGNLPVMPDAIARVVINERTGTVIVGDHVRLSRVLITHANLIVSTAETPEVSQPAPFSQGQTAVVPRTTMEVTEDGSAVNLVEPNATVGDLAKALNVLGVSPRDLSSIFQQLKEAGALHAELEFN